MGRASVPAGGGKGRKGIPLPTGDVAPLRRYWRERTESAPQLVLRREFVRPHHEGDQPYEGWFSAGMRDAIRHRGVAARLLLVMLYEHQVDHARVRKQKRATPVPTRPAWRDTDARGRLLTPSWATLTLGYQQEPVRGTAWRRSRSDAVRKGFARLNEIGLYDSNTQTLLAEDRPWRWDDRYVDRRYTSPPRRAPDVFVVPKWLFTSGAYASLTGAGLYVALAACEYQQAVSAEPPFHHQGLRWDTFDAGESDLLGHTPPADLAKAVQQLRRARQAHDAVFRVRRDTMRDIERWQVRELARLALENGWAQPPRR